MQIKNVSLRPVEAEAVRIAKNERPLVVAIDKLFGNDLPIIDGSKDFLVLHLLQALFKEAKHDLIDVVPPCLEEAVDKKSNRLDAHVSHHELVSPLVNNRLEVDRILCHLNGAKHTSFPYQI